MSDFQVDILSTDSTLSVDVYATPEISVNESTTSTPISLEFMAPLPVTVEMMTSGIKGDPGGAFLTKNAATALGGHRLVILNPDDTVSYASSMEESHAFKVIGITTHASGALAPVIVATGSTLEDLSWSWVVNQQIFLATDGLMTQDSAVPNLFLLPIGVAVAANRILISINQPIWR